MEHNYFKELVVSVAVAVPVGLTMTLLYNFLEARITGFLRKKFKKRIK